MKAKRIYHKHSISEKLRVISLYEEGFGSGTIGQKLGVAIRIIRSRIRRYAVLFSRNRLRKYVLFADQVEK